MLKSVVEFGKTFYTAGQIFLTEIKPVLDTLVTVLEKTATIVLNLATAMLKLYQEDASSRYKNNLKNYIRAEEGFEKQYGISYEDALKNKPDDLAAMRKYMAGGGKGKDVNRKAAVQLHQLELAQDLIYGYEKL